MTSHRPNRPFISNLRNRQTIMPGTWEGDVNMADALHAEAESLDALTEWQRYPRLFEAGADDDDDCEETAPSEDNEPEGGDAGWRERVQVGGGYD